MKNVVKIRLTDRKRESILDAAVQEFGTSGFDNTSMDRIAEIANASKRTVYNHFPSKEELFAAIVDRLQSRCDSIQEYSFDPRKQLEPQLRKVIQTYVEMVNSEEFKDLARIILPRFLQTPDLAKQLLGDRRPGEQSLVNWIKSAQLAGQLKKAEPVLIARQLRGMLDTFAFWPQVLGSDPPLTKKQQSELIRSTVRIILDHYGIPA